MNLHHARPVCRAPNRFSPSSLLYQHFVAPYHVTNQQRFSSASAPALAATENEPPQSWAQVPKATKATTAEPPKDNPARLKIRRIYPSGKDKKLAGLKRELDSKTLLPNSADGDTLPAQARASERYVEELMLKTRHACDNGEEYPGVLLRPCTPPLLIPEQRWPWAAKSSGARVDAMSRLTREINDFYDYARPTRAETFARKNVVEQVRADVRRRLPDHILEVFGSERTGMALALSDIDLRIVKREALDEQASDKPPTHEERRDNLRDLYTLRYKTFDGGSKNKSAAKYKDANLRYARYPLISVQDRGSGIDVQIVAANNTAQQRGLIQRYMKEYPFLRQTYAVIKTLFDQRGLSDVFRGGFGSYTLFMMLVASLQNQANQRRDAAGALVNFLYYWAYFKTKEHGVSIAPPEYFDKQENPVLTNTLKAKIAGGATKPLANYLLSLRDPADRTNDLGRKASAILHAQTTLRYLTADMIKQLNANDRPSLLAPLVGDVYARERKRREKLSEHGLWIQQQAAKAFTAAAQKARAPSAEQQEADIHGFLEADAGAGVKGVR